MFITYLKRLRKKISHRLFINLTRLNRLFFRSGSQEVYILTKKHTLFLAKSLHRNLEVNGVKSKIFSNNRMKIFSNNICIVICPQEFKYLPPNDLLISYQLEQYVSNWFDRSYLSILKESRAVWDYSLKNIEYLLENGIDEKKISYVPVSIDIKCAELSNTLERDIDILFYGDIRSDRRKNILQSISEKYNIKIISDLYGSDLVEVLLKTKLVLNIHFYENALLETTRICEALSHGCDVLSETSSDMKYYPELLESNKVTFFQLNDLNDLISKLDKYFENERDCCDNSLVENSAYLSCSEYLEKAIAKDIYNFK